MMQKLGMVGWYDPRLLLKTGIRVAVSTAFGRFADKREAMAAANALAPQPFDKSFDYAKRHAGGDFWFDYLADTGDGWNPTYAMARLVSEERLAIPGTEDLPRGRLLLLGGDQVYPTASDDEYRAHFLAPFEAAYEPGGVQRWPSPEAAPDGVEPPPPDLYAIPGNHDWYDGLSTFFALFCRRRVAVEGRLGISRPGRIIAGRRTQQTRSYFALKLPGGWWLWGTDSQLEGYIDEPQVDFFQHVASAWMEPESKLILCVADPSWAYVDPDHAGKKFKSFAYLERLAWMAQDAKRQPKHHRLKLVLTGDSHHYARYVEDDRHYIVCGGGGAFLHPTHHLEDKVFKYDYPKPGEEGSEGSRREFRIARNPEDSSERVFPDRGTSRRLAYRNLFFAGLNKGFTATLFGAYAIFNWMLDFNANALGMGGLATALGKGSWCDALYAYATLVVASPWPVVLMLAALGGYYYFADARTTGRRFLMGGIHGTAQILLAILTTYAILRCLPVGWGKFSPLPAAFATLASAVVSATLFGCYLLISLNGFGRHPNEAFSSLRIEGYKSFLRLRISGDGRLTIFPIGIETVPDYRGGSSEDPAKSARLIEQPIEIPPGARA